jgi:hypothetical protein
MPANDTNFYLRKAMGNNPITVTGGASGFFSTPEHGLDPDLFNGDHLKGEVRAHLVQTLFTYLATRWAAPHAWARAWIAGSGITYQWAASRGNGDLDVLLGADWAALRRTNPRYEDLSNAEIATDINEHLRRELWPRTTQTRIGSKTFEVTFYLNQNSTDIRAINPYAAYDLIADTWTVRPPKLPPNPAKLYPAAWRKRIVAEACTANEIIGRFNKARSAADAATPGGGAWTNAMTIAHLAADQATSLYDDIHLGRRLAFADGGEGYGDWHNYRWQSHKANGVVEALATIKKISAQAGEAFEKATYGHTLTDYDQARRTALLWARTEHP